jgi:hypothetical protein
MKGRSFWVGEKRVWTHRNGKRVEAALINLTDEEVSLAIGELIWRQALADLSEEDLRYVGAVKRGEARLYPEVVPLSGSVGWFESVNPHEISVSGERAAGLPAPEGRFEEVLAAAIAGVKERCVDIEVELRSFEEWPGETKHRPPHGMDVAGMPERFEPLPVYYRATFVARKEHHAEIRRLYPHAVSPASWPTLDFCVYFLSDGAPADVYRVD